MNDFYFKNLREVRALDALEKATSIPCSELGKLAGAHNCPQVVHDLRQRGLQEFIVTSYYSVIDRDGQRCRVGSYSIPSEKKHVIRNLLNEAATRAIAAARMAKKNINSNHNHNAGE